MTDAQAAFKARRSAERRAVEIGHAFGGVTALVAVCEMGPVLEAFGKVMTVALDYRDGVDLARLVTALGELERVTVDVRERLDARGPALDG